MLYKDIQFELRISLIGADFGNPHFCFLRIAIIRLLH
jgi:hypothetical protein